MLQLAQAMSAGFSDNCSDSPNGNDPDVESLSIWPAVAALLKAEQYEQAAELLLKAQLASQPLGSEANIAFLIIAREICQACHQ